MKKEKLSKAEKTKNRLIALYTLIFILIIVLILVNYIFNKYLKEPEVLYRQIGNYIPVSVTTKDAHIIREYAVVPFKAYLGRNDYESAYSMCTKDFREAFTLEDFINLYKTIDVSTLEMKDIKAYSDYCYEATIVYKLKNKINISGDSKEDLEEVKYLIYINKFNTESMSISPNGYLYSVIDKQYSGKSLEVNLKRLDVYLENLYLDCEIKNVDWFSSIFISDVRLGLGENMSKKAHIAKTLEKEETFSINTTIENSNAFMPDNIQFIQQIGENEPELNIFHFENQ